MRRGLVTGLMLMLALFVQQADAWIPDGSVYYSNDDYMYRHDDNQWRWLNTADNDQWVCQLDTGSWFVLGSSADPMKEGWLSYDWPHAYSFKTEKWYYFQPNGPVWCVNMTTALWSQLGWPAPLPPLQHAADEKWYPEYSACFAAAEEGTFWVCSDESDLDQEETDPHRPEIWRVNFSDGSYVGTYVLIKPSGEFSEHSDMEAMCSDFSGGFFVACSQSLTKDGDEAAARKKANACQCNRGQNDSEKGPGHPVERF